MAEPAYGKVGDTRSVQDLSDYLAQVRDVLTDDETELVLDILRVCSRLVKSYNPVHKCSNAHLIQEIGWDFLDGIVGMDPETELPRRL